MHRLGIAALLTACQDDKSYVEAADDTAQETEETGEPGLLSWDPPILLFEDMEPGVTSSAVLIVENAGTGTLALERTDIADSGDGTFYMEMGEDLSILPGESLESLVAATLTDEGYRYGSLRIRSNDPENGDARIPLCAFTEGNREEADCLSLLEGAE